jgi:hypothetical protein
VSYIKLLNRIFYFRSTTSELYKIKKKYFYIRSTTSELYKIIKWYFLFQEHDEPLFSSHMLDLSEEFDEENISTCVKYFKRMAPMKIW